jgi:hypothetical protein
MRLDYTVSVTRNDGSQRVFHVYGLPPPHRDEVIALPVDGEWIKAKIDIPETDTAEAAAREI